MEERDVRSRCVPAPGASMAEEDLLTLLLLLLPAADGVVDLRALGIVILDDGDCYCDDDEVCRRNLRLVSLAQLQPNLNMSNCT